MKVGEQDFSGPVSHDQGAVESIQQAGNQLKNLLVVGILFRSRGLCQFRLSSVLSRPKQYKRVRRRNRPNFNSRKGPRESQW